MRAKSERCPQRSRKTKLDGNGGQLGETAKLQEILTRQAKFIRKTPMSRASGA
jgi:hypothetical protein